MTSHTVELEKLRMTRIALTRLSNGETYARRALFSTTTGGSAANSTWQINVLNRLVDKGIIRAVGLDTRRAYKVNEIDGAAGVLTYYLANDQRVSGLIWPSSADPEDEEVTTLVHLADEPGPTDASPQHQVTTEPPDDEHEDDHEEPELSSQAILEGLLKLGGANMQNVIYMREGIDELRKLARAIDLRTMTIEDRLTRLEALWK